MFALISKDAGGAEYISRYVKKINDKFCISSIGPAKKIFKQNFKNKKIIEYKEAINRSSWVLCSTGVSNDFEKKAMIYAQKKKKRLIVFLDSWTEYKDRFLYRGKIIKPDKILVSDIYAYKLAKKNKFKNIKIVGNHYIKDFKKYLKLYKNKKKIFLKKKILFLTEPVGQHLKKYYTEKSCLKFFLSNSHIFRNKYSKIHVRPHPSENVNKYSWVKKISKDIKISKKNHLYKDILESNIIIGINTIAMVLGLIAKKKVISCIDANKKCELPHKKIIYFKNILKTNTLLL